MPGSHCPVLNITTRYHLLSQLRVSSPWLTTLKPTLSGFITAAELGQQRKRVCRISTGSKQLDSILGG